MPFDVPAVMEHLLGKRWCRMLGELHRSEATGRLFPMPGAVLGTIAPARDQLQLVAGSTDLMELVRIIVGIGDQIALDGCGAHQTLGHDPLVLIHRCDAPSGDGALGIDNGVDFIALGLTVGGSAEACLTVLGTTTD